MMQSFRYVKGVVEDLYSTYAQDILHPFDVFSSHIKDAMEQVHHQYKHKLISCLISILLTFYTI
jgi:hypothetical protein